MKIHVRRLFFHLNYRFGNSALWLFSPKWSVKQHKNREYLQPPDQHFQREKPHQRIGKLSITRTCGPKTKPVITHTGGGSEKRIRDSVAISGHDQGTGYYYKYVYRDKRHHPNKR